jgi:hypothetical protein
VKEDRLYLPFQNLFLAAKPAVLMSPLLMFILIAKSGFEKELWAKSPQAPPAANQSSFKVDPDAVNPGVSTDVVLTGQDISQLLPQIADLKGVEVYSRPTQGNPQKVSTIVVVAPAKEGGAKQIRLGLNVASNAVPGKYELYVGGKPIGAVFSVSGTATSSSSAASQVRIEPSTSPPGQVVDVKVTGGGIPEKLKSLKPEDKDKLHFFWQVPPGNHTDYSISLPVTDFQYVEATPKSESNGTPNSESNVMIQISIAPDALPGTYQLFLESDSGGKQTQNPVDVKFVVGSTALGEYTFCPLTALQNNSGADLLCSQSLVTYKEAREVFGKAVADQYVAVEVRIQNRNTQYPFLLADVRLGASNSQLTTSRDRTFVRTFAEKARHIVSGQLR